ncbi:hypothetical protein HMPREF2748_04970 [Corynebacterium sp. HMSC077B05]|nr:hypothetical protein HMPREF2748_04970 [Corynebacterium sp. HMSC077B05]
MDYIAAPAGEGESKYQYSQFCECLRTHIRTTGMTSIIEHEPGQELYVDWTGDKVSIIDKATGDVGMKLPDPVGAGSLDSRLKAGQRIELGDYDMRQHLAHAQTGPTPGK